MNKGGIGSASIVLVFAVLCLSIFTMVSLLTALTEDSLITTEIQLVEAFYAADTVAEMVLAEILAAEILPENIRGIDIEAYWDWDTMTEIVSFVSPITDTKELYVVVAIGLYGYEILSWRMFNIGEWQADDRLNVWQGPTDGDFIGVW